MPHRRYEYLGNNLNEAYCEIKAQGVDRLFEAKLLIVGEGGAGKTSLLRRMFMPEKNLPTEDETTRGIEIHRHEFPISGGRTFRLNTWDFGGQQIYHATHQFFLTRRSLYVLVDDTRSDQRSIHDEGFKFWLEVVETLSEHSPLLIFQNEKGGRSKQIDYADVSVLELLDGMNLEQWLERASKELSPDDGESATSIESEPTESQPRVGTKNIRIYLASSSELRKDRDAFDLYCRQQNDRLLKEGFYLKIDRWENTLDAVSSTRLQDEYNKKIRDSDLFVSLFATKTGKYTQEEFDVAYDTFQETGKPLIYTYFRQASVSTKASNRKDLVSLWDFQNKLNEFGHFFTEYESIGDLTIHFRDQLDKLLDGGLL